MRVVILTTKMNFTTAGGSVGDIDLRAKALQEMGHQVLVVSAFSRFDSIPQALPYKVAQEEIGFAGLLSIQRGTYRLLKKYEAEADVFHVDGQVFLYGAGWYRLWGGKPVVAFFNHWLTAWADESVALTKQTGTSGTVFRKLKKSLRFLLERLVGTVIANRIDAVIYNTPKLGETFMRYGFKKGLILGDFLDSKEIIKREGTTHERITAQQSEPSPFTILCAGRMLPEKGFDLVIKAFAKLPEKKNLRVIMSGTGPELVRLKELAHLLGVQEYISFPGWVEREELLGFFRKAHLFIFPKWWPDYGAIVLEEALSFGLPSIIPSGGSLSWLSGDTARTFEADNVDDLARTILELRGSSEERIRMAEAGLVHVQTLDYRTLARPLEALLRQVAEK